MIGRRTHKQASVEIIAPLSIPVEMREQVREVYNLQSTNPRKGHATALMHQVCAEADRVAMVLMLLVAQPDDTAIGNEKMIKFYGRFGFKPTKDDAASPVIMIRPPERPVALASANLSMALAGRINGAANG